MLSLFLLKRDAGKDHQSIFDATHSFIVAAKDENQARTFAASYRNIIHDSRHRDEVPETWHAATTSCLKIGVAANHVTAGVILEDHQWG